MVFGSPVFLTAFLPLALFSAWGLSALLDRFVPADSARRWGPVNALLFALSLAFYAWGEGWGVLWLAGCALANDAAIRLLARLRAPAARRAALAAAVAADLALLGWFKYAGFLVRAVDLVPGVSLPVPRVALPLGISFYVFQAVAAVVDAYRGSVAPARSPVDFGCYLAMFPQLVAGPIVRFSDVAGRLRARHVDAERVGSGMRRFLAGLAKKALLADTFAEFADAAWGFADRGLAVPALLAWLALVSYALQIYYDFSGYSDMAIGIGRMLGFDFPENFLHPYAASSVRDFWRRWHVTLSGWFRDYLYIPLGGSRRGRWRTCRNSLVVFALCGLWHGAGATFLLWGLWHGLFLSLERLVAPPRRGGDGGAAAPRRPVAAALRAAAGRAYAAAVVLAGWLLFRSEGTDAFRAMARSLAGAAPAAEARALWIDASPRLLLALAAGLVLSQPGLLRGLRPSATPGPGGARLFAQWIVLTALGLLSLLFVAGGSYNAFIYFRF